MPSETAWYVENKVLFNRMYGAITNEDLTQNSDVLNNHILEHPEQLILIVDMLDVTEFPFNFKTMLAQIGAYQVHKHVAWVLVIADNRLVNFFGTLVSKVTSLSLRSFNSMDEVYAFINHNVPDLVAQLPPLEPA
ncbi:MAG: hypothetical protein ABI690_28445 [Chloroflexota bacterium]